MKNIAFRPHPSKVYGILKNQQQQEKAPKEIKEKGKPRVVKYDSNIGIYIIVNESIQKAYVGQSKNIPTRLRNHRGNLKNNIYSKKGNLKAFQDDADKYGIESFKFLQICSCEEHELYYWETHYCKEYFDKGYTLYNHFMNTEITGLLCPDEFKDIIQKAIKLLDRGVLNKQQFEQALYQLENYS
jgi:hypothetical protein